MEQIRKLTSEPAVFLLIIVSLLLINLTTPDALGSKITSIYGLMLIGDFLLFTLFKKSQVKSVSGNSGTAFVYANIAFAVLFILYQGLILLFRQSTLNSIVTQEQLGRTVFQTVFQSITKFGTQEIDFSKFAFFNFYLFGILIPLQETRTTGRIYGALASLTNIDIGNFKSYKTWSLIGLVATLFMYFHLKVRGINNNLDLAITFIFMLVSLVLIGKTKELESANYLHIEWNSLGMILGKG